MNKKQNKIKQGIDDQFYNDNFTNDLIDKLHNNSKPKIPQYFNESQFHCDYEDTITAFTKISPNQTPIFNKAELPVKTQQMNKSMKSIKQLVNSFVNEVNLCVENSSKNNNNGNGEISGIGWNENKIEKREKTGWELQQEELGLPSSVFDDIVGSAPIRLIEIDKIEKYETNDQIKIVLFIIVQKTNTKDMMIIRISFVIEKTDINIDRDFFDEDNNFYETKVMIEEIFVIGFLSNKQLYGTKGSINKHRQDFYEFDSINDNSNGEMMSDKKIIMELNKKKREFSGSSGINNY